MRLNQVGGRRAKAGGARRSVTGDRTLATGHRRKRGRWGAFVGRAHRVVNKDADAPIFQITDSGLVVDAGDRSPA